MKTTSIIEAEKRLKEKNADPSRAQHYPHLDADEVQTRLDELETATGQRRHDLMTELAWRPAWAIRSRRGTLGVLKEMIRGINPFRRHPESSDRRGGGDPS